MSIHPTRLPGVSIPYPFDLISTEFTFEIKWTVLNCTYVCTYDSRGLSFFHFRLSKRASGEKEKHAKTKRNERNEEEEKERREGNKSEEKDKNTGRVIDNLKNKRLLKEDWKKKTRMDERNFHSRILTIKYGESIGG